jgi:hypothetical protein
MQTFLDDSDEDVSSDRDPYLRLDGILAGTQKGFDTQMLLDPFEEQFGLPALLVKCCDHLWLEREIVGQQGEAFPGLVPDHDTPQRRRIILARLENRQYARLIAQDVARGSIDWMRIAPFELGIAFCSGNKEGVRHMQLVQPGKIQIAAIRQILRAGFDHQIVEDVDLVGLAVGDVNEAGDGAAQIEQRLQFDGRLGGSKRCPWIHRQAQIDRGGIERIDRRVEAHAQRFVGIQRAGYRNQMLGQIGIDLPGARRIRIGQRIARNGRAAKSHVVQPVCLRTQIDFDIAQRFSMGQLRKRHREELIQTGKILDLVLAPMGCHAAPKSRQRQISHELRKNEFALMHRSLRRRPPKSPHFALRCSNRDQTKTSVYENKSLTYGPLMWKRWDTSDLI